MSMDNGGSIGRVCAVILGTDARRATVYVAPDYTVKITARHKPRRHEKRREFVLTIGRPNFAERKFIRACIKVGESFPVKRVQVKFFKGKRGA